MCVVFVMVAVCVVDVCVLSIYVLQRRPAAASARLAPASPRFPCTTCTVARPGEL